MLCNICVASRLRAGGGSAERNRLGGAKKSGRAAGIWRKTEIAAAEPHDGIRQ
jgi:hypothetical protein